MRQNSSVVENLDWIIISLYVILVFLGWLNIHAAVYNEEFGSIFDFTQNYGKQLVWIITAFVIVFLILSIDSEFYTFFAYAFFALALFLLFIVNFVGVEINGSRSWFAVGSIRIQPAEFAKFTAVLAIAKYLSGKVNPLKDWTSLIVSFAMIGIPAVIIILQNETGTALVFASLVLMLFREGLNPGYLIFGLVIAFLFVMSLVANKFILIGVLAAISVIYFVFVKSKRSINKLATTVFFFLLTSLFVFSVDYLFENKLQPHQKRRINVLLGLEDDPYGAGYNVNQSLIAIGSGGFFGKGYLQGTQTKYNFVPEQSTDFIFCTIGEEWGFLGSFIVIALFVTLLSRIIIVAERQRSTFSRIYGYGVASIIFFHVLINIGMTIGLAPVIGIPLPFFSYGGSSLWSFTILLFIFVKLDASRKLILR
jgi:rod shape determining protein RodA